MKDLSVIIVEDDIVSRRALEQSCESLNYNIDASVGNPQSVFEFLGDRFDVANDYIILMDISLESQRDGIDAAIEIYDNYNIPVIYTTGNIDPEIIESASQTVNYGYLIKPVSSITLSQTVKVALERLKLQKELNENKKIINAIMNSQNDTIFIVDLNGIIVDCNEKFSQRLEFSKEELLHSSLYSYFPQDFITKVKFYIEEVLRTGNPQRYVEIFRKSWNDFVIYPIYNYYNNIDKLTIVSRDISEIKDSELEKEKAFNELAQVFDTINIGIWLVDLNCNVIKANSEFYKMFELSESEIIGSSCSEVLNKDICNTSECTVNLAKNGILIEDREYVKTLKNKKNIIYKQTTRPFYAVDGSLWGVLSCFVDMTEQRRLQSEIIRAVERERQTLGQDLHDSLGQKLSGLHFLNQALIRSLTHTSPELSKEAQFNDDIIVDIIDHTRRLSKGLNPIDIGKHDIEDALHELAYNTEKIFKIKCNIYSDHGFTIEDSDKALHLYYIIQESVNNAIRHGKATIIDVYLKYDENVFMITIKDNGSGKNLTEVPDNGIGLITMSYRAQMINGIMKWRSDSEGFSVEVVCRM